MFSPTLQIRPLLFSTFRRIILSTLFGAVIMVPCFGVVSLIEWRVVFFNREAILILFFCSSILSGPYEAWIQRASCGHRLRSRQTCYAALYGGLWALSVFLFIGAIMSGNMQNTLIGGFVFGIIGAALTLIPINNTEAT